MSERKRVVPDEGWVGHFRGAFGKWRASSTNVAVLAAGLECCAPANRIKYAQDFRLYHATTQQWAEWDEALGGWVEAPAPDAQVTLPPAIPQEPEGMLLEGVLTELWDSTLGKVDQGRTVRLLARYRALTGKERPEFMRGH